MPTSRHGERTRFTLRGRWPIVPAFAGLTATGLAIVSPRALLTAVLDAAAATVIVVPPLLAGLCVVLCFRLGRLPWRWHLLVGASLGLGITSLSVLSLGLIGVLQRFVWVAVLAGFMVVGVIRLRVLLAGAASESGDEPVGDHQVHSKATPWLWLALVPFLILALLAAANAPGFIWAEEGNGYDVLEYHLQMPKEYFQAGRVTYAPHNVYANFPMNVEMLYLLAMVVHQEIFDIGTTANVIHLMLGVLTVYAAWVVGREWSPRAGQVSAIAMGSVGWLGYLSGLAYVELGTLFFSATAVGALLRAMPRPTQSLRRGWLALSGICSGFACGCKYTAVPFTVLTISLAIVLWLGGNWRVRAQNLSLYLVAAAASFAPWLMKNALMTGNPVFPLLNGQFHGTPPGWGERENEKWDRGHAVGQVGRELKARVAPLWQHVPADADQRFGPAILLLAVGGLVGRRLERTDLALITILLLQLVIWRFTTHLYARFTVPLLVPLSMLAGRALVNGVGRRAWIVGSVLLVGAGWNLAFAVRLQSRESPGGAPASLIYDGTLPGLEYLAYVNHELPANARVLVIGDAKAFYFQRQVEYGVVFNRSAFGELVENGGNLSDIMHWLREQGYTHLLVHWGEVRRLSRTYGFSPHITPQLFDRLAAVGLKRMREFRHPEVSDRWVDLYEMPLVHRR